MQAVGNRRAVGNPRVVADTRPAWHLMYHGASRNLYIATGVVVSGAADHTYTGGFPRIRRPPVRRDELVLWLEHATLRCIRTIGSSARRLSDRRYNVNSIHDNVNRVHDRFGPPVGIRKAGA
jgi:hypothetical protein